MRLKVSDLLVGTEYAIQVRANDGEEVSEWSRRFQFVTVRDDTEPKTPTNVTWVVSGDSYMAEWDSVNEDVQGRPVTVIRYSVRVQAGGKQKILGTSAAPESESGRQRWDLMFQRAVNLFGIEDAKEIVFSVRSVIEGPDGPVFSQWSTPITASNDAPEAPTNGVAKSIIDGIELSWTESVSSDVVGYNVYGDIFSDFTPNAMTKLAHVTGDNYTYFTSTYQMHYFVIRAVDAFGQESADLAIEGEPKSPFGADDIPPPAPTAVSGTMGDGANGSGIINLSWSYTGPVDPEEEDLAGFAIRWKPTNPALGYDFWTYSQAVTDIAERSANVQVPKRFASYTVEVASFDKVANYSAWTPATVSGGDGDAPPAPVVEDIRVGQNTLEFRIDTNGLPDDVVYGGVWHYEISNNATFTHDATGTTNDRVYTYATGDDKLIVTGLESGAEYWYKITVTDAEGISSSPTYPITSGSKPTLAFPLPPGPTDGLVPAKVVDTVDKLISTTSLLGAIEVSWPAVTTREDGTPQPDGSVIHYEVHAYTPSTTTFTPSSATLVTTAGGTSAQITSVAGADLVPDTDYYIRIIAKDADGLGLPSDEVVGSSRAATSGEIPSISAGKIDTGTLAAAIITIGSGGAIQSADYSATLGYKLDETGLIINNGTVSATALKGGTISGTTINVGAGGVLNVDSTAVVKSNNYSPGISGWQLDASGLEINDGSVSANLLTGGTINAGTIYVSSTIQDSNGYWSIGPSAINIYNGTISGASVYTNQLRSNTQVSAGGVNRYTFTINASGYAEFTGAYIYGNTIVSGSSSHYIQSSNYSSTQGWRIRGDGYAEFNNASIKGTLTASGTDGSYVKIQNQNSFASIDFKDVTYTYPAHIVTSQGLWLMAPSNSSNQDWGINISTSQVQIRNAYITDGFSANTVFNAYSGINMQGTNLLGVSAVRADRYEARSSGEFVLAATQGQISVAGGSSIRGKFYATAGDVGLAFHNSGYGVVCGPAFDGTPTSGNTRNLYATRYYAFTTSIGSASDRRVKKDISPFGGGIDILKKVDLVSYRLKDDEKNRDLQYGVIAQDSLDLMEGFIIDMFPDEDDDLLAANYHALNMATTSAVQELIEKIETLESRINELESRA